MYQIGDGLYEVWLKELDNGHFQWALALQRWQGRDTTNRGWCAVGPTFPTREKGARYLGWKDGHVIRSNDQSAEHLQTLVDEYNALFTSEVATR